MEERFMITRTGYANLNEELYQINNKLNKEELQLNDNEKIILKNRKNHLETTIPKLNIKNKSITKKVQFANTVVIKNLDTGKIIEYTIVGTEEVDISNNKISNLSPFAKELLGKEINEEVMDLNDNEYEIIKIY